MFGAKPQAANKDIDWRKHGFVTPVRNQAQCGSCWAFSATEELESAWLMAGHGKNTTLSLAEQQVVSCDDTSMGCGGGETESAYEYIMGAGGLVSSRDWPYTATNGECHAINKANIVATMKTYERATSWYSESELVDNLFAKGPISVCVDAANWQSYKSGIMTAEQCAWFNMLDHCVQLVGFQGTASEPYYQVRK